MKKPHFTFSYFAIPTTIFFVILCLALMSAYDTRAQKAAASKTAEATEASEPVEAPEPAVEETENADDTTVERSALKDGIKVQLTDDYYFYVPEDYEEVEMEDFGDEFSHQRRFIGDGGAHQIRCLVYTEENVPFPDIVEWLYEDNDAQIGYGDLFETAVAKVRDTVIDNSGRTVYRTAYLWPDGSDDICFIEVASYEEEYKDLADHIFGSIVNPDSDIYARYGIPSHYTPDLQMSDEELQEMLEQDQMEAMKNYYYEEDDEQYYDYDPSLRGGF